MFPKAHGNNATYDQLTSFFKTLPRLPSLLGGRCNLLPVALSDFPTPLHQHSGLLSIPPICRIFPPSEALHFLFPATQAHADLHMAGSFTSCSNTTSSERPSLPTHCEGTPNLIIPPSLVFLTALIMTWNYVLCLFLYLFTVCFSCHILPGWKLYESRNLAYPFSSCNSRAWNSVCRLFWRIWQTSFKIHLKMQM